MTRWCACAQLPHEPLRMQLLDHNALWPSELETASLFLSLSLSLLPSNIFIHPHLTTHTCTHSSASLFGQDLWCSGWNRFFCKLHVVHFEKLGEILEMSWKCDFVFLNSSTIRPTILRHYLKRLWKVFAKTCSLKPSTSRSVRSTLPPSSLLKEPPYTRWFTIPKQC